MSDLTGSPTPTFWQVETVPWISGRGRLVQAIELEERTPPLLLLSTVLVLLAGIAAFLGWASLTRVDEIATASGEISPVGTVRKLQHLEGGIVAAIDAHEGDLVEAGQPVIELDPGMARPELEQLRARLDGLLMQQRQLAAFKSGSSVMFASQLPTGTELAVAQNDLLISKRNALDDQRVVLRAQIEQRRAELASLLVQRDTVKQGADLLDRQIAARQQLVGKGSAPLMGLIDLQRDATKVQAQIAELDGQISRTQGALGEAQARLPELESRNLRDAAEDNAKLETEIAEVRENVARAEDRVKRLFIRSPVRGTVKGLQTETIGGVIQPGSTVLEVVPSDVPLIVEARVLPKDIGFVKRGQNVVVKVGAYDYTHFGGVDGRIETVSATTFEDGKGSAYYRARIRLAADHVGEEVGHNMIIPGMTVTADIKTGDKSVMAYLLKPIVKIRAEALHER